MPYVGFLPWQEMGVSSQLHPTALHTEKFPCYPFLKRIFGAQNRKLWRRKRTISIAGNRTVRNLITLSTEISRLHLIGVINVNHPAVNTAFRDSCLRDFTERDFVFYLNKIT